MERLIPALTRRGLRVATLKHDAHGFEIDREGKDSWRHRKSGSSTVALSSPERLAVIMEVEREWGPGRIIDAFLSDADVVLTEGYKSGPFPKIEVVRLANSARPVCSDDPSLLAYVTDARLKGKIRSFGLSDYSGVASLIEKEVIQGRAAGKARLVVDGAEVPLKPFIEGLLRDGVAGMVRGLKGCGGAASIELRIRLR
jgi:molybdopterin-guanine dinucleotide biosynthesis protein B